mmetsp:Transcript_7995/g.22699  ORF Transcript_7995/g.22699 Transcript_7995/m.22699 type:complete len:118 (-) Transcript_7995:147-500(-)
MINGERQHAPHTRGLGVDAASRAVAKAAGLELLESGNMLTGLTAALLTEGLLGGPQEALALLSVRESLLQPESLTACIEPALALLEPASALQSPDAVRAVARKVQEREPIDRSLLYA